MYAVYVKYKTLNGEEVWGGNTGRTDESREIAERETVKKITSIFDVEKVLKIISFEYEDDEEAPSFCEETDRADKEERKEFALVEIADALHRIESALDIYSLRIANKIRREDHSTTYTLMIIAAIAALTMLGVQTALLLWRILH